MDFIDIEPNIRDNKLLEQKEKFNETEVLKDKNIIYRLLQQDKNVLFIFPKIVRKKLTVRKQAQFAEEALKLDISNNCKKYDRCVIGSDEVFNCLRDVKWGFTSQLFGNVKQAEKVITYAASCGFTKYVKVPEKMKDCISDAFKNISSFSVRDENTKRFVESFGVDNISINLDPVVVGDFTDEIKKNKYILNRLPSRYCVIYAYNNRICKENEIEAILNVCKEKNIVPISIGGTQKWVHHHFDLTPFQVLVAFKNAAFVVTDTFHGTIFSANFLKRFAVIVRDSNSNKLNDLIKRLELEKHRLDNIEQIKSIYEHEIDRKRIDEIIMCEQKKSFK